jgi:hypothetical protein
MPSSSVHVDPVAASGTSKRPRAAFCTSTNNQQIADTSAAVGNQPEYAVPLFAPTPSSNKAATVSDAVPQPVQQGQEGAARPVKKRKVQSAVLAWFGDIVDMDEDLEYTVSSSDGLVSGGSNGSGGRASGGSNGSGGRASGGSNGSGSKRHGSNDSGDSNGISSGSSGGGSNGSGSSNGSKVTGSDVALLRALEGDMRFGNAGKNSEAALAAAAAAATGGGGATKDRGLQQADSTLAAAVGSAGKCQGTVPSAAQKQTVLGTSSQQVPLSFAGPATAAATGPSAGVFGISSRKGSGGLEAQLAAAAETAGVEACDVDMNAEMCAAMDTAALFAYAGDV